MKDQTVISGKKGFTFEFKLREGTLHFIRYQEGCRETAFTNQIPIWLYLSPSECIQSIRRHLAPFVGVNERVIRAAIAMMNFSGEVETSKNSEPIPPRRRGATEKMRTTSSLGAASNGPENLL